MNAVWNVRVTATVSVSAMQKYAHLTRGKAGRLLSLPVLFQIPGGR